MPVLLRILVAVALACGLALWFGIKGFPPYGSDGPAKTLRSAPEDLPPYPDVIREIDGQRRALAERLRDSRSAEREEILGEARRLLQKSVARDLPSHWLGTPWDFNGVSQTPGEGQIACGYFVSTVLRDAGFKVERVPLAQQPSGNIIRTLTAQQNVKRLVGKTFDEFLGELRSSGTGIYVIGLDRHVGLIAQSPNGAAFIHSDGGRNKCVVVEAVEDSRTLRRSRWREFANLSADNALLQKWLLGGVFPTQR